jgi:hypothetical protein
VIPFPTVFETPLGELGNFVGHFDDLLWAIEKLTQENDTLVELLDSLVLSYREVLSLVPLPTYSGKSILGSSD